MSHIYQISVINPMIFGLQVRSAFSFRDQNNRNINDKR